MNSIKPNEFTYLIGYWQDGTFWCVGEYSSEDDARRNYYVYCQEEPNKSIELIQQIKTFKGLEYHHPKLKHETV